MAIQLEPSWLEVLAEEFEQPYMTDLRLFLKQEKASGKVIYPEGKHIFNAFNSTPIDDVRVVILGQDPYHGAHQAHGLSFSVPETVAVPPSLKNIYKELNQSLGKDIPVSGNLLHWAQQGVLLLNSVLTVEAGLAASHQGKGWERFTDKVVSVINENCANVVFMLWGAYAQKKGARINTAKHLVLKAPYPSPLSAHRGFIGCGHFEKANRYLAMHQLEPIAW